MFDLRQKLRTKSNRHFLALTTLTINDDFVGYFSAQETIGEDDFVSAAFGWSRDVTTGC